VTQLPAIGREVKSPHSDGRTPPGGAVRPEILHTRNENGVGMNEWEQQVLAGYLAELGERVERLAQLAEEVAYALDVMTGPASVLPGEPAAQAA
jgi:tetrahydromethanopterin S-methyltransferase subunit B